MNPFRQYLKAERGRTSSLARHLGINPAAISQWKEVPPWHVLEVERLSGISRHDLRPDIFGPPPFKRPEQRA